jgi:hypothetical protein
MAVMKTSRGDVDVAPPARTVTQQHEAADRPVQPLRPCLPAEVGRRFDRRGGLAVLLADTFGSLAPVARTTPTAADGSKIHLHGAFNITSLADGTVTSCIDRFTLTCP